MFRSFRNRIFANVCRLNFSNHYGGSPFVPFSSTDRDKPSRKPPIIFSSLNRGFSSSEELDSSDLQADGLSRSRTLKSMGIVKLSLAGSAVICMAKFGLFLHSGSSVILSEAIHSLVDGANQIFLYVGLRKANNMPDTAHPYGYGRSVYFWSLISALGSFFLGAGMSILVTMKDIVHPGIVLDSIGVEAACVLSLNFLVDGFILSQTIKTLKSTKPSNISWYEYLRKFRDPTTIAILVEDSASCFGVMLAMAGVGLSKYFSMPIFDACASLFVSLLLGSMGLYLTRINEQFLLGQSVEKDITAGIRELLLARPAIDAVHSVQSQWIGPYGFSYKAEVDFDGTFLAAKLLTRYQAEFKASKDVDGDLQLLLAWYAEDVMRCVEREVREAEKVIRSKYPEAIFIELEPDSKELDVFAIDQHRVSVLRKVESEKLRKLMKMILEENSADKSSVPEEEVFRE